MNRCPFGHPLGPGQMSLTWDMRHHRHRLYCNACQGRTRIAEGGQWEVHTAGRWVPHE